jgi:D-glycero-D-manno-heptose 1,7-bisphosphate phosphatase
MNASLPLQCIIFAGGLGTRLGDAVRDIPKPMLDIGGEPFLARLIREIARFGFSHFILLAGYLKEAVEEYFTRLDISMPQGVSINGLPEPGPLGTGGALLAAAHMLDDKFLLFNGASLCLYDIHTLLKPFHAPDTLARLTLMSTLNNERYGEVIVEGPFITEFRERAHKAGPCLMNAGVYFMQKNILNAFPPGASSLEKDIFPTLAKKRLLEFHTVEPNFFIDIGLPEDLARAKSEIPKALRRQAVIYEGLT